MFAIRTTLTLFVLSFFAVCCLHLLELNSFTPLADVFHLDVMGWHVLYALGLTAMSWLFFGMVYILRFLASRIDFGPALKDASAIEHQELG